MEYKRLGSSGLLISTLSYGSWITFDEKSAKIQRECMHLAYDNGVNFFDNAEVYAGGESETVMGQILKESGWSRDSYIVSSKVFWGGEKPTQKGLSRKHVVDACHAALRRLQLDYIDLYYCHRPDFNTPVEETVRTMNSLIEQGKILYWGTSEWPADLITQAHAIANQYGLIGPTMEQPQYNMLNREKMEKEFLRLFRDYQMGTTVWSPLASGILTGKYMNGVPEGSRFSNPALGWLKDIYFQDGFEDINAKLKQLIELGNEIGLTLAQLAIAWCLKNENVSSVILGATKKEQLAETMKAQELQTRLTPEIMVRIDQTLANVPTPERVF